MQELSFDFNLKRHTLYQAVNYLDRYLAKAGLVVSDQLQLVGLVALHIASKKDEVTPPAIKEYDFGSTPK